MSIKHNTAQRHKLAVGDSAPEFAVTDTFDNPVSIGTGKSKYVLLVFLRYAGCPWCNMTIHRLSVEYPLLQDNGCDVIAFMQSSAANIDKKIYHKHKLRPQYPIIPDVHEKYYKQYGVTSSLPAVATSIKDIPYWLKSISEHGLRRMEIDGNLLLVPASFLVERKTGKIVVADYGSSFYDHSTFTKFYEPLIFTQS